MFVRAAAGSAYLLIAIAFFGLRVLPGTSVAEFSAADLLSYHYPMIRWGFARLWSGDLPLWNPYQACGTPFLASTHFGLFYPLYLPFLVLPAAWAVNLDIVLHLTIASIGMYWFCRHVGLSRAAAFLGGIVYAYQGSTMMKVYFPAFLASVAWDPFAFVLVDRVLERPSARRAAALAAVVALSLLGGHGLQFAYFETLALLPFLLFRSARLLGRSGAARVARAWGVLFVGAAAGGAAALVRLLPTADFVSRSWRMPGSLGVEAASIMAIAPHAFWTNLFTPGPGPDLLRQVYVGIVPLGLAALGLALWRTRSVSIPIAAAGLGAVLYSFGSGSLVYEILFRLPLGNWFRGVDRGLVIFGLAVALLAAAGLDEVLARAAGERRLARRGALLATAVGLGIPVVLNAIVADGAGAGRVAIYAAAGLAVVALAGARPPVQRVGIALVAGVVLVDLWQAQTHRALLPSRAGQYFARNEGIFEEIRSRQTLERTYVWATFPLGQPLSFNSDVAKAGLNHGVWLATDYDPLSSERFERYMDALGPRPSRLVGPIGHRVFILTAANLPLVELMGIRFYVVETGREATFTAGAPELTARWRLLRTAGGVSLYEDPGVLPRSFVVGRVDVERDPDRLLDRLERADPTALALVEEEIDPPLAPSDAAPASATIAGYAPERVSIDTDGPADGFLVLTDQYDPGWRATVDGVSAKVYPTDDLFRGVRIPAGRHHVELVYRPRAFLFGVLGSVVGLASIALLASIRSG